MHKLPSNRPYMTHFRFHIEHCVPDNADLSSHDLSELIVVVEGCGLHLTEFGERKLEAGDVFVINNAQEHAIHDKDGLRYYHVLYDPNQFLKPTPDTTRLPGYHALFHIEPLFRSTEALDTSLRLRRDALDHVVAVIAQMQDEYLRQTPGFQTIIMAYFLQLVV